MLYVFYHVLVSVRLLHVSRRLSSVLYVLYHVLVPVRLPHVSRRLSSVLYVFYHVLVSARLTHVSRRLSCMLYVFYYVFVSVKFPHVSQSLSESLIVLYHTHASVRLPHVSQMLFYWLHTSFLVLSGSRTLHWHHFGTRLGPPFRWASIPTPTHGTHSVCYNADILSSVNQHCERIERKNSPLVIVLLKYSTRGQTPFCTYSIRHGHMETRTRKYTEVYKK